MIFSPFGPDFQWTYSNVSNTRLVAGWGFSQTCGTVPTFSAYATLVSSANITNDVYLIELIFNNAAAANTIRNLIINIGVDNAGGTSFVTKIPNLIAGFAGPMTVTGGITYQFPLYIPRGSSIGIQSAGTAAFAFNTAVKLYGQPRRPDSLRVGSYVTSFGASSANAQGTAVQVGTTNDGVYNQVGATTTRPHWWWQVAHTVADNNIAAVGVSVDLVAGSSTTTNKLLIENAVYFYTAAEQITNKPPVVGVYNNVGIGENIYMRLQTSGAAETAQTVAAYGLGG